MSERYRRRELIVRAAGAGGALALGLLAPRAADAAVDPRLRDLARVLRGDVVARGAAGYASARISANPRFDTSRPLAVAYCESVQDVQRCLRWAVKHGVHLTPRSGGHSYGGFSSSQGLVIDVSRLDEISIAAGAATATIGAGAKLIDVEDRLWRVRRALPAGSCPTVGIAGLTLGGGVGFASRAWGLTCDSVLSLRLVDASGAVRDCSSGKNADLFWACRGGGGGNFGIVTSLRFRLHPVDTVTTFVVDWPWADAKAAVAAWQAWAPNAPDELFSVLSLSCKLGAAPRIRVVGQFLGGKPSLDALLPPLLVGSPTRVGSIERTYLDAGLMWAGCSGSVEDCHFAPAGTLLRKSLKGASAYANAPMSSAAVSVLLARIAARTSSPAGTGTVLLDSYRGAIGRVPATATAFAHRGALFSVQIVGAWDGTAPAAANVAWVRATRQALAPHLGVGAYVNYIDPDLAGWERAYYGANYPRLQRVKRRVDPTGVFRFTQSIRPAA